MSKNKHTKYNENQHTTKTMKTTWVRSGTPTNWTWRQANPSSGRKVPQGTLTNWVWDDE